MKTMYFDVIDEMDGLLDLFKVEKSYKRKENDNGVNYIIPFPGISKDDLEVKYDNESINIKLKEKKDFCKDFTISGLTKIDPSKIEVLLEQGLLTIKTFYREELKPLDIKIK